MPERITIVCVDDNPADRTMFAEAVREARHDAEVICVSSAEEAMALLQRQPPYEFAARPGLVVIDLHLPGRDGCQLAAELACDPRFRSIPVVVLTGSDRGADEQRCREMGVKHYVAKPFDVNQYFALVSDFLLQWFPAA